MLRGVVLLYVGPPLRIYSSEILQYSLPDKEEGVNYAGAHPAEPHRRKKRRASGRAKHNPDGRQHARFLYVLPFAIFRVFFTVAVSIVAVLSSSFSARRSITTIGVTVAIATGGDEQ